MTGIRRILIASEHTEPSPILGWVFKAPPIEGALTQTPFVAARSGANAPETPIVTFAQNLN